MSPDHLLACGAALICAAIAVLDPVTWWRNRRRGLRAALEARLAAPTPSTPPAPTCSSCPHIEVVAFQAPLPASEIDRINTQLRWHRSARREGRA